MSKIHIDDLIGNKDIRTQLVIAHGAAKLHNKAMRHMLFSGQAGCGKTTTSKAVAALSGAPFFEVSPEAIRSAEDLAQLFEKFPADGYDLNTGEKISTINPPIVFIDEAHRLSGKTQEILGIAMENLRHTYTQGRGKHKSPVTVWVPEFTLICATTKEGDLTKPFRDRFKMTMVFGHYTYEESLEIVRFHAKNKGLTLNEEAVESIAKRGRGTPRTLVGHLDGVHDLMTWMNRTEIDGVVADAQFKLQGIDEIGLTELDIIILKELYNSETPKGLDSLAVKTNLDARTIAEVNEPYLIRLGFIERTRGGRIITDAGIAHLTKTGSVEAQEETSPITSRVLKSTKKE